MTTLLNLMLRPFHRPPDFKVGNPDAPYMLRWHILPRNRWFNIYLHQFLRDDDDRALHDHPWHSLSIILRGGYIEHLPGRQKKRRKAGRCVFRRAEQAHRIELHRDFMPWMGNGASSPKPAWTLFITGPRLRDWGFHCPNGWRHWKEFAAPHDRGQIGRGCD
jgi:hypothetical protein